VQSVVGSHKIQGTVIRKYLFHEQILLGLRNTIILSVVAQAIGIVLGILLAVMRLAHNWVLKSVGWFYIWLFRGTPVLVQLILWFNLAIVFAHFTLAIPFTHVVFYTTSTNTIITVFVAALLGLGLNEGAYMAEIVRAGILSVDEGQTEAAHALGMTRPM